MKPFRSSNAARIIFVLWCGLSDFILPAPAPAAERLIALSAERLPPGKLAVWPNAGTLGGRFAPGGAAAPAVSTVSGRAAVVFEGKGDFLASSFAVASSLGGRHPFTAAAWVFDPEPLARKIVASWSGEKGRAAEFGFGTGFQAGFFSAPLLKMGYRGGPPKAARWQHIAVSYDGARLRLYLGGALNAEQEAKLSVAAGDAFRLGAGWNPVRRTPVQPFSGSLAAFDFFDAALGPDEIWRLAGNAGRPSAGRLADITKVPIRPLPESRRAELRTLLSSDPGDVLFFVASDLHYGAAVTAAAANARMIEAMNELPGKRFPKRLGPDVVGAPRGVVLLGDLIDDGNSPDAAGFWNEFTADYDTKGAGRLAFPVYEGVGNHDGDPGRVVRDSIKARHPGRPGLRSISPDGLHYSWDWGPVHCVQLNLFPGADGDDIINPWGRPFEGEWRKPRHSLEFLVRDLAENVGSGGRPVVLFQHYGWDEWSRGWWSDREREALAAALKGTNVVAIFWGHSHAVQRIDWNGIPTWCVGSANKEGAGGEFLVVRLTRDFLSIAERRLNRWGLIDRLPIGAGSTNR
jgi:hypothetical protein